MKGLFVLFFLALPYIAFLQKGTIRGFVNDENNQPIQGASVIYKKDVTIGSLTNEQGKYELEIPSGTSKLICRFTGMKTDTITITLAENQVLELDFKLFPIVLEHKQVEV